MPFLQYTNISLPSYYIPIHTIWFGLCCNYAPKLKLVMKLNHQLQQHHYPVSLNIVIRSINKHNLKRFYFVRASPSNRVCYWFTPFTLCQGILRHYCPAVLNATTWFGSQFVPSQGAKVEPQWGEWLAKPIRRVCRTGQLDYYIQVTTIYYGTKAESGSKKNCSGIFALIISC